MRSGLFPFVKVTFGVKTSFKRVVFGTGKMRKWVYEKHVDLHIA